MTWPRVSLPEDPAEHARWLQKVVHDFLVADFLMAMSIGTNDDDVRERASARHRAWEDMVEAHDQLAVHLYPRED